MLKFCSNKHEKSAFAGKFFLRNKGSLKKISNFVQLAEGLYPLSDFFLFDARIPVGGISSRFLSWGPHRM